jgi:drug/metabolite transporter (DMT)-like permease
VGHSRWRALPYVVLLGVILGLGPVVVRFSLRQFEPVGFRFFQYLIGSFFFLLIYVLRRQKLPTDRVLWQRAGMMGFVTVCAILGVILSLQYLSSGVVSLILTLIPVTVAILAHRFLPDEKLTIRRLIGAVVAFAGVGLVLMRSETGLSELTSIDPRGVIYCGIAILGFGSYIIYARRYLRDWSGQDVIAVRSFCAMLILLPLAWYFGGFELQNVSWTGWLAAITMGVGVTFGAYQLEFFIIKRYGATVSSQVNYISPLAAAIAGALFLGEQFTLIILLGMAIVFTGLRILNT